jgi:hypothetical protein
MPIKWNTLREDNDLIIQIAERVERDMPRYPDDRRTLVMDLTACHVNGCALDLRGLLAASKYEFSHDVYGIRKAINRRTGKLTEDVFLPRYAAPTEARKTRG